MFQRSTSEKYEYDGARTRVRTLGGLTGGFEVKVGLHQGSALILFLFIVVVDVLTGEIGREASWSMLFADDIVLYKASKFKLEE